MGNQAYQCGSAGAGKEQEVEHVSNMSDEEISSSSILDTYGS